MEPSRSLDTQIFSRLDTIAYRNISQSHNPLDIPDLAHVDRSQPMDILISQDCSGFNLGSFLVKRSEFTRRVLDMWWDPIFYEQKYNLFLAEANYRHMEWDHKEQDAFVRPLEKFWFNNRNTCIPLNPSFVVALDSCLNVRSTRSPRGHVKGTKGVKIYFIISKTEISLSTWPVVRMTVFEKSSNITDGDLVVLRNWDISSS